MSMAAAPPSTYSSGDSAGRQGVARAPPVGRRCYFRRRRQRSGLCITENWSPLSPSPIGAVRLLMDALFRRASSSEAKTDQRGPLSVVGIRADTNHLKLVEASRRPLSSSFHLTPK
jgi:hypothetical protein